jgi:ribosomal protein S6E (S10)
MGNSRRRSAQGLKDRDEARPTLNLHELPIRESIRNGIKIRFRVRGHRIPQDVLKINNGHLTDGSRAAVVLDGEMVRDIS